MTHRRQICCIVAICGCGKCQAFRSAAKTAFQLEVYRCVHWCVHDKDEALCTRGGCAGYCDDEIFSDEDYDTDDDKEDMGLSRLSGLCSCLICSILTKKADVPVTSTDHQLPGRQA